MSEGVCELQRTLISLLLENEQKNLVKKASSARLSLALSSDPQSSTLRKNIGKLLEDNFKGDLRENGQARGGKRFSFCVWLSCLATSARQPFPSDPRVLGQSETDVQDDDQSHSMAPGNVRALAVRDSWWSITSR